MRANGDEADATINGGISMTTAAIPTTNPSLPPTTEPSRPTRRDLLAWSLATSGVLFSGGAWRVLGSSAAPPDPRSAQPPFDLETIPTTLGNWGLVQGSEMHLDALTTRITGSTGHVLRTYENALTGTALSALILFGPAEPVLPHTPQVCYPASGYRSLGDPVDRTVRFDDQRSAVFRSAFFTKSGGRTVVRPSVYHSYRLDGVWSPIVPDRSLSRRRVGLFKVQIHRLLLSVERLVEDEPIESFLRQLLPALEQQIAAATKPRPDSAADVASTGAAGAVGAPVPPASSPPAR